MAKGTGTTHHKLRHWTGLVSIILLPFFLISFALALSGRADGFTGWLTLPLQALPAFIFLSAAIWYCKLEFDEVILDYTDGSMRSFGLLINRVIAFAAWAIMAYVILSMRLGNLT